MGERDYGVQSLGQAGEKTVAQLAGGRLDAIAALGGELPSVAAPGLDRQAKMLGRLRDQRRVGFALRAAKLVVEMGGDESVSQAQRGGGEQVQQCHRVDAAGDGHDDAAAAREGALHPDDVAHSLGERMHESVLGKLGLRRLGAEQQQPITGAGSRAL